MGCGEGRGWAGASAIAGAWGVVRAGLGFERRGAAPNGDGCVCCGGAPKGDC